MDSRTQIEQRAAEWLAQRDSGRWSAQDQSQLTQWLETSTAHAVEFLRLEAVWEEANRYRAMGAGIKRGMVPTLKEWRASPFFKHGPRVSDHSTAHTAAPQRAKPSTSYLRYALAATILIGVCIGAFVYQSADTYSTKVGETTAVPLSDGSTITLNTASKIQVSVTDTRRSIELQAGEAYFEVAKDVKRPFTVTVGSQRITALGTAFSVRKVTEEDVRVAVTEGSVAVTGSPGTTGRNVLTAGSTAQAVKTKVVVRQRPLAELQEQMSWRTGFIVLHHTPLVDAVAEFNRYNARQIVIQDLSLAAIPISGNFRVTNVEAFGRLLRTGFGIRLEDQGDQLVLREP